MARPIESTPVLVGREADRLARELANGCTPQEARARIALAKKALAELRRTKFRKGRSAS